MKKVFVLVLSLIVLGACALQSVRTEVGVFPTQDYSFDMVWKAATQTSVTLGYRIVNLERDSGILILTKERNVWTQNEPPQLNVLIIEVEGSWQVTAQYVQPGQFVDTWGVGKKAVKKYLAEVYTVLNR